MAQAQTDRESTQAEPQRRLSAIEKGRHAELLAQTALLANGWTVSEPIAPEPFDLTIKRAGSKRAYYVQVKTANVRSEERYGTDYVVVRGAKNNGDVYTRKEVDYFVTVLNGDVYMFDNREISEYWSKLTEVSEKWTKLETGL